jgi:hypothetical protein
MRQILIEKYIEPSEVIIYVNYVAEKWLNKNYDLHSFMGQPAYILYNNKKISCQCWYKKGELHRDKDFPAEMGYKNGKETYKWWYKNGIIIKNNISKIQTTWQNF